MICQWLSNSGECNLFSKQDKEDPLLEKLDCDKNGICKKGDIECI